MWSAEKVVRALRDRGERWDAAPGLVGLRGDAADLRREIAGAIGALARAEAADDWIVPQGIALDTLRRAEYFASFPQWLTLASHLGGDEDTLARVAGAGDPCAAARAVALRAEAALAPAVCYHVFQTLTGRVFDAPETITAEGTCWRHEGARLRALERGWAFTMREIVRVGDAADIEAFRLRGIEAACTLASSLGLLEGARVEQAADPFFAPTARGKALLQRVKALKHELLLPIGDGRSVAAASFNHHEAFFGESFDLRDGRGAPAATGCVAFGVERWLLAYLVEHGPDARGWPGLTRVETAVSGGVT